MWINRIKNIIKSILPIFIIILDSSFISDASEYNNQLPKKDFVHFLKDNDAEEWVDSIYNSMTIEQRIGQLFMVQAYSNKGGVNSNHAKELTKLIEEYHIGGLIFFQGGPVRQAILTNHFQAKAKVPLMISIDGEWGLGMRLDSTISFPRQMMLGAIHNDDLIYDMGVEIAKQCKRIGINVNFAPVVDINNNPRNPVINNRAFGENKYNVTRKGIQYMLGMQSQNIITTAKHFPGHGDTEVDSHFKLPILNHSQKRIDTLEAFPFRQLIKHGLTGVMVGHLHIPALDKKNNIPSTLSYQISTNYLKKNMKFKGLVFTDALNMQAVREFSEPGEVELKALMAGNDVLLYPTDVPVAIKKIKDALESGLIKESIIANSCKKILFSKKWLGLDTLNPIKIENIVSDLNNEYALNLNNKLIESSITLIQNHNETIPFKRLENKKIATVVIGDENTNNFQEIIGYYSGNTNFNISKNAKKEQFDSLLTKLTQYNTIIVGIVDTRHTPANNFGISQNSIQFVEELSAINNVILTHFGNAYGLASFNNTDKIQAILLAYQDTPEIHKIAAQVLFGGVAASGKLPVTINDKFKVNDGIIVNKATRLRFSLPIDVGLDAKILNKIDSFALLAITEKATPGCQILVARNNSIVYHKSFGHHSYDNKQQVVNTDVYDLASITKMCATTIALMHLYDENKFSLDSILSCYLPELDTTNKGNLWIRDILTHQARLRPWIPFYLSIIKDYDNPSEKILSRWQSEMYPTKLGRNSYIRKDYTFRDSILSAFQTDTFSVKVADNLYMNIAWIDTIYRKMRESQLEIKKEYKYSDLGFIYLKDVIERITKQKMENFVDSFFYNPMGASSLGYKPLTRIEKQRIVPTEDDLIFRKQLLQGYVHDPAAAMFGGVAGHAGLFSNAVDLAKVLQMLLNNGTYGNDKYLNEETVNLFTSCPFCNEGNRRGYGFDKPNPDTSAIRPVAKSASPLSYGHSGFTGTLAWVEPNENFIYIFLSNRIHPETDSPKLSELDIRPSIHQTIYDAIIK